MASSFWKSLLRRDPAPGQPEAGVYHFLRQDEASKTRLHLRVEADGRALLMVNAARAFHLNPTAAYMAYMALNQVETPQAVRAITRAYNVPGVQAQADYAAFTGQLETLLQPDGPCPFHELDLEALEPFSDRPSAPYRMDLALTYRCNDNCSHCYNARPRNHPELNTGDWKRILDQLWSIGVPHIIFTGGEPTLRPDLPELIRYAENLGQITGLNTNGRRLKDGPFVQSLVDAGLDHVQITLESHDAAIHDAMVAAPGAWHETVTGIKNAVASRMFVMTNTTMLQSNSSVMAQTLGFLAELGVPTVGLNALIYSGRGANVGTGLPASALPALLEMARASTERNNQRLIWYTPTEYCHFDPVQMDLGVKGCTAALYNMCVEPDGAVLPCQSYYHPLGNLLTDEWESIWNHDLAVSLRERRNLPTECNACALLPECGGGCPLERQAKTMEISPLSIPSV